MVRRGDLWAIWGTVDPDVELPSRVVALRHRRQALERHGGRPDVLLRRWWQV